MLSKNQLKYYSSLKRKKFRNETQCFLAEGDKIVRELLANPGFFKIKTLLALPDFINDLKKLPSSLKTIEISPGDLNRISSLTTPNQGILEIKIPDYRWSFSGIKNSYSLYLENIQDPGNLGTIIRTADWFGIGNIFCSPGSVDVYNPKVIQSTMGSISRVKVHYLDPIRFLDEIDLQDAEFQTVAAVPGGENIYNFQPGKSGVVFFGNESKGLSINILYRCKFKSGIPSHPFRSGAESLNVSISAGIICSELLRKELIQNAD